MGDTPSSSILSSDEDFDETSLAPQVRQVYLITYSQANLEKFPTRRSFAECVQQAFQATCTGVMQWVCCRERHSVRGQHYHMAVKLKKLRRWSAVKSYLREKEGITVHFSNAHNNYFTAWRYVTKEDEEALESPDHPYLWNSKPPRTQKASEKRASDGRTNALELNEECASTAVHNPRKRNRLSAFDLSEIIVQKEIKTRTELLALAQDQKKEGKNDVAEFIFKRGDRVVSEIINTAWEMTRANEQLERSKKSRIDILTAAALGEQCVSGWNGLWYYLAHQTLQNNGVEKLAFTNAIVDLLKRGRGKYRNILIVGPANCGKTFVLNPLNSIFNTFTNPATTTFAWVGAEQAECIFLNDFRWSNQLIAWHELLLMLEGQPVRLSAPKTHYAKDVVLDKDTPIFATGKHTLVYIKNGYIDEKETKMVAVRWKVFYFNHQINEAEQHETPACGRCFAKFILGM